MGLLLSHYARPHTKFLTVPPYGVYDVGANLGYVSLGIDHDTGQFAVNGVRLWLDRMGRERYPTTPSLMITADGGGSNGSRLRLWKVELQQLADETGLFCDEFSLAPARNATLSDNDEQCSREQSPISILGRYWGMRHPGLIIVSKNVCY